MNHRNISLLAVLTSCIMSTGMAFGNTDSINIQLGSQALSELDNEDSANEALERLKIIEGLKKKSNTWNIIINGSAEYSLLLNANSEGYESQESSIETALNITATRNNIIAYNSVGFERFRPGTSSDSVYLSSSYVQYQFEDSPVSALFGYVSVPFGYFSNSHNSRNATKSLFGSPTSTQLQLSLSTELFNLTATGYQYSFKQGTTGDTWDESRIQYAAQATLNNITLGGIDVGGGISYINNNNDFKVDYSAATQKRQDSGAYGAHVVASLNPTDQESLSLIGEYYESEQTTKTKSHRQTVALTTTRIAPCAIADLKYTQNHSWGNGLDLSGHQATVECQLNKNITTGIEYNEYSGTGKISSIQDREPEWNLNLRLTF